MTTLGAPRCPHEPHSRDQCNERAAEKQNRLLDGKERIQSERIDGQRHEKHDSRDQNTAWVQGGTRSAC